MTRLSTLHKYGREIDRRLRLQTLPLAVKLLEKEEDIPEAAQRPLKDLGHRVMACQGFAISRRGEVTVAMLKEDMYCFEPVVGYGIEKPPQYFLDGYNRFPGDVKTLEAGSNYAREFPRLEYGKYIGVVSAPLTTTNFEPDVVMIYCNTEQLSLLLLARESKDGYNLKCSLSSHAACVYSVVPVMQSGNCHVAIPCRGDRYGAMAKDFEMIFTAPKEKLEDLLLGLRYVEKHGGSKLPRGYQMQAEGLLPEVYGEIGKMLGMFSDK
jgi:uncharacterized protein (DUF169 family)